jgi:hypothetical protein
MTDAVVRFPDLYSRVTLRGQSGYGLNAMTLLPRKAG